MREDLTLKEYAKSKGWKVIHPTYNDNVIFEKVNITIWYCGGWEWDKNESFNNSSHWIMKTWWQARNKHPDTKIYEPFETHRRYKTLKEALDNES